MPRSFYRRMLSLVDRNMWRLERNPPNGHGLTAQTRTDKFRMFVFHWEQSCWWPPFWSALFRFDEEYDPKTRGWRVAVFAIPLFAFSWQFRYPTFVSQCVETSMWVSVLPGLPEQGAVIPTTYCKVWERTRITDYRSWEEAARHHATDC